MSTGNPFPLPLGWDGLKSAAILRQGRSPIVKPQSVAAPLAFEPNGAPSSSGDGQDTKDLMVAWCGVRLRRTAGKRTAWYKVLALGGGNYGVAFGSLGSFAGNWAGAGASTVATAAAVAVALEAWAPLIAVEGSANVHEDDTSVVVIEVPDLSLGPMSLNTLVGPIALAQPPNASLIEEASTVVWRVWGRPLGQDWWTLLPGATFVACNEDQLVPIDCAGYDQLYVEVLSTDGVCVPVVGQCVRDDQRDVLLQDAQARNSTLYRSDLVAGLPSDHVGRGGAAGIDIVAAAETPDATLYAPGSQGSIPTSGVEQVVAGFGLGDGVTAWEAQAWHLVEGVWAPMRGGTFTGDNGNGFSEAFDVEAADAFKLFVTGLTGGSVQRFHRPLQAQHGRT